MAARLPLVWVGGQGQQLQTADYIAFPTSPTVPTPSAGDNSTKVASTAFVQAALASAGGFTIDGGNATTDHSGNLHIDFGSVS